MPLPVALRRSRRHPTRASRRVVVGAELALGLLLGAVGGWIVGLLRVRRP